MKVMEKKGTTLRDSTGKLRHYRESNKLSRMLLCSNLPSVRLSRIEQVIENVALLRLTEREIIENHPIIEKIIRVQYLDVSFIEKMHYQEE